MKLCGSAYSTDNPNATFYANQTREEWLLIWRCYRFKTEREIKIYGKHFITCRRGNIESKTSF